MLMLTAACLKPALVVQICMIMFVLVCFRDKSAAEKRRQLIQESKFLGGDMEHTHLVKGLDFALLQKVSSHEEQELLRLQRSVSVTEPPAGNKQEAAN